MILKFILFNICIRCYPSDLYPLEFGMLSNVFFLNVELLTYPVNNINTYCLNKHLFLILIKYQTLDSKMVELFLKTDEFGTPSLL